MTTTAGWTHALHEGAGTESDSQYAATAKQPLTRQAVVVGEDEVLIALQRILIDLGWRVSGCHAEDIVRRLFELDPDVVICTRAALWQPVGSGPFMFAEFLKYGSAAQFPILILPNAAAANRSGAKHDGADRDDAALSSELVARVQFILRPSDVLENKSKLTFEDLAMDTRARRVFRGGREIRLRPTEFCILRYLLENPRRVYPRRDLIRAIWGPVSRIKPRTVDVHIRRLRAALNGVSDTNYIRTLPSVGYALDACP
jgi:two-component system, OmpR family, phosphate regulon response regulator PhoB